MNLTISLPDTEVRALEVKAKAQGMSAEQYALQVLERDLAADSEPCRSPFRTDVDHDSEVMPISIPN